MNASKAKKSTNRRKNLTLHVENILSNFSVIFSLLFPLVLCFIQMRLGKMTLTYRPEDEKGCLFTYGMGTNEKLEKTSGGEPRT